MKTKLFILLLFSMAIVPMALGQKTEVPEGYRSPYFDREDYILEGGDTIVYLYEKGNRFRPERTGYGAVPFKLKEMSKDFLQIFREEFPDLTYPDDLRKWSMNRLSMYVDQEGNVVSYYYRFKSDDLSVYPDMEKRLYNFAESAKRDGLMKYGMYALPPDSYYELNFHFAFMHRALVFPEKEQ